MTKDNSTYMNTLYESFIKYYKDLVRNSWRSHLSKVEAAKALESFWWWATWWCRLSRMASKENSAQQQRPGGSFIKLCRRWDRAEVKK